MFVSDQLLTTAVILEKPEIITTKSHHNQIANDLPVFDSFTHFEIKDPVKSK